MYERVSSNRPLDAGLFCRSATKPISEIHSSGSPTDAGGIPGTLEFWPVPASEGRHDLKLFTWANDEVCAPGPDRIVQ